MQTLEDKIATLKKCGLTVSAPFTEKEVFSSVDRQVYDKNGYDMVLVQLGSSEEEEPYRNYSTNVWHFDTEAIEDHGDYKRIAERMVELSGGSLSLQDIKDYVDVENGKAWLSFTFKGKPTRVNFEVHDDWVDTEIFKKFVELLNESDPSKLYLYYDLGGQDCIISCVKKTEFQCLKSGGVNFVPL